MPDVSWYSGQGLRVNGTTIRDGTTNRLLRNDGTRLQNSLLSDDGTDVTLVSGDLVFPADVISLRFGAADATHAALLGQSGAVPYLIAYRADGNVTIPVAASLFYITANLDLALGRTAAGVAEINSTAAGTLRDLITRCHVIGTATQTVPASPYLIIQGVSGAGGTPTTSHLTAGSAIAAYVQQAHDGQATKYVVAYNNYNGVTYLSIPLDGSTVAWTQSQTRP